MENNGNKLIIPAVIILGGGVILYILTRPKPQQSQQTPQPEPAPVTTPEPVLITTPQPKFTPIPISVPVNGQLRTLLQLDKLEYRFIDPSRPPIPIAFTQIQPGDTLVLQNSEGKTAPHAIYGVSYYCIEQKLFVRFTLQNLSNTSQNVKLSITARSMLFRSILSYLPGQSRSDNRENLVNIGEVETSINRGETKIFEFCAKSNCMPPRTGITLKSSDHINSYNAGDGDILLTLEIAGQKPLDKYVLLKWRYSQRSSGGIRLLSKC